MKTSPCSTKLGIKLMVLAVRNNCTQTEYIILNMPHRHDLMHASCVNKEVRKTNAKIKLLCAKYINASLLDISNLKRGLHTRHGQHLNNMGKNYVINILVNTTEKLKNKQNVLCYDTKGRCQEVEIQKMGN